MRREPWPKWGRPLPEDGEEAGGDVEDTCGGGLNLVFINQNPLSPPALHISE